MKQKFRKLEFVQIGADTAIIDGSYSQIYGGENVEDYQVYILRRGVLSIKNKIAWVNERDIQPIDHDLQNRDVAEQLIENYNLRKVE